MRGWKGGEIEGMRDVITRVEGKTTRTEAKLPKSTDEKIIRFKTARVMSCPYQYIQEMKSKKRTPTETAGPITTMLLTMTDSEAVKAGILRVEGGVRRVKRSEERKVRSEVK